MSEQPINPIDGPLTEDLQPSGLIDYSDQGLRQGQETAEELTAAYAGWLERRGALEDTPHLTMTRREFELFKSTGLGDNGPTTSLLIHNAKESYGIPPDTHYAVLSVSSSDTDVTPTARVVVTNESDFGTTIEVEQLAGLGIRPEELPKIALNQREFGLLQTVGFDSSTAPFITKHIRSLYGIPQGDQVLSQYALVDIVSDDPSIPPQPELVIINDVDFGTTIDRATVNDDFQSPDQNPESPLNPESGGATRNVDITDAINTSGEDLYRFASDLMRDTTDDPLGSSYGDVRVRAGGLAPGQKDAFVWEVSPFTKSVELTIAFPDQYDSVCIVRGQRREAVNGKAGMAQIVNPEVVLKIDGQNLKELQSIYHNLYHEPDFALTETQKKLRDEIFNSYLADRITNEARSNRDQEQARRYQSQQPRLRERQIPRS